MKLAELNALTDRLAVQFKAEMKDRSVVDVPVSRAGLSMLCAGFADGQSTLLQALREAGALELDDAPLTEANVAAGVQRMKEAQALRILEILNAAGVVFSCGPVPSGKWMVRDGIGTECQGVNLTDALAQFAGSLEPR
jgi:hypothetical protein